MISKERERELILVLFSSSFVAYLSVSSREFKNPKQKKKTKTKLSQP